MTAVAEQTGAWLQQLREAAFQRFTELGFPTTHDEEWRFTNVAPIARIKWDRRSPSVVCQPERSSGNPAPRLSAHQIF